MRRRSDDGPSLRGAIACCLLAVAALSLGPTGEAVVRAAVRDAARPGFMLAGILVSSRGRIDVRRWPWTTGERHVAEGSPHRSSDDPEEHEVRRLRAELALARNELKSFEASLGPVGRREATAGVMDVERVPARVLNAADPSVGPGGLIIAAGAVAGVEAGRPAVSSILLTAGESDGISNDAAVLAGAAVVGRTAEVGAWTSTVVPVTAAEFRAHVRLVRESSEGTTFGDEGVLEGDGRGGCVVKYVPSTAAVTVGDHVYSHDPSGRIPQPLYFGRIEAASLREGAPHWEIRVRPAADAASLSEVHVLRLKAEPLLQTAER